VARHRYAVPLRWSDIDGRAHRPYVRIDPAAGRKVPIDPGVRRGLTAYSDDGDVVDPTEEPAGRTPGPRADGVQPSINSPVMEVRNEGRTADVGTG
jgi:hypothetical protein